MRPLYFAILLVTAAAVGSMVLHPGWLADGRQWAGALWKNEAANFRAVDVEGHLATTIQKARRGANVGSLLPDDELRVWLENRMEAGGERDLATLTGELQMTHPRYISVAAFAVQSPSTNGLADHLGDWREKEEAGFTHQAIVARPRSALRGFECVAVVGTRLPEFSPEALGRGGDKFYSICSLCGQGQPCQIPSRARSFSLVCPHCHRTYAVLAADTHQRFHYVNDYLMGYEAPAHFKSNLSKLDEMMTIWKAVVEGVRYLPDSSDGNPDNDAWQIAQETQMLGTGDCEDSSIYLADWLLARGFEVRVCMGRYSEMGGHAWVVVRLDGKSYLLESTNPHANTKVQPLSADVGSRYVPEISFDRQAFYVRSNTGMTWDGDYWTETKWQRVAPQPLAGKLSFGALPSKTGK